MQQAKLTIKINKVYAFRQKLLHYKTVVKEDLLDALFYYGPVLNELEGVFVLARELK